MQNIADRTLVLKYWKGAYSKDDRNFSAFLTPSPLWTQNDIMVNLYDDVIITNTDRILATPPPP